MNTPFKYYLSNERPFSEKTKGFIRGRRSLNISRQKGDANLMDPLFQA